MSESLDYNGVYFCMTLSGHIDHVLTRTKHLRGEIFNHPEFSIPYRSLWDFRELGSTSGGLSEADFRSYMVEGGALPEKIAYVVGNDLVFGLIRQFTAVRESEDGRLTMLLTYDMDEADRFLRS